VCQEASREVWSALDVFAPDLGCPMTDTGTFGAIVLLTSLVGLAAVVSSRFTERVRVPLPALVLAAAAVAVKVIPVVHTPDQQTVNRVVTVALVCVLFYGGMHIGWVRFRGALAPITVVGVLGTFLTAIAGAVLLHAAFGFDWYVALLLATALAPTDPTVVFSVLGRRQVAGRAGTILEGESGANDPVGIAVMASLIAAGGLHPGQVVHAAGDFVVQMAVGAGVGLVGGRALLWFVRRVPLPSEGLYPLRTLAAALALFGAATVAHGSGFLAVFVAGIALGDERAPYKRDIERFHGTMASLGEIVAFAVLGLTVDLAVVARADVWVPGLLYGIALAVLIRPVLVGLCLIPARMSWNERGFVVFAGLKGAVPILLGGYLLTAAVPEATRLYGIVIAVVVFSVVVQGSLADSIARLLRLPVHMVEPEPWALGVRLRHEPDNVHQLTVAPGSPADGRTVALLDGLPPDAWITLLLRDGKLLPVRGDTQFHAGDILTVLADASRAAQLAHTFEQASI
jgi:cell volume regulation protein A